MSSQNMRSVRPLLAELMHLLCHSPLPAGDVRRNSLSSNCQLTLVCMHTCPLTLTLSNIAAAGTASDQLPYLGTCID
jgi:hypothetical protein